MPVEIHDRHIAFTLRDPDLNIGAVKLLQEVARPRLGPEFVRFSGSDSWTLYFPRPEADRMEYQLQLNHPDGGTELVCDPTNPLQAEGPFGPKSVLEFPGYEPPAWVGSDTQVDGIVEQEIKSRALRRRLRVAVWSTPDTDPAEPLPLLVAHDGPEYAQFSQLLVLLTKNSRSGTIPPMRSALLQPVDRDEIYSASSTYARALAHEILPALSAVAPTAHGRKMRIGMGASPAHSRCSTYTAATPRPSARCSCNRGASSGHDRILRNPGSAGSDGSPASSARCCPRRRGRTR